MLVADTVLAVYNELDCHVKSWRLFVPAKLFTDVVKDPDGDVNLVEDSFLIVTGGQHGEFLIKYRLKSKVRELERATGNYSSNTATLPCDKVTYIVDQVQFCSS